MTRRSFLATALMAGAPTLVSL
ncbi:MAG: hypothetical protein FJY54_03995 [Betaproteobacteria bacterium]|nr:hypothetical protein [Betaproteobacteria bacterium]